MEKKRSIEVTIFVVIGVALSLYYSIFPVLSDFFTFMHRTSVHIGIFFLIYGVISASLLFLKNYIRRVYLFLNILGLSYTALIAFQWCRLYFNYNLGSPSIIGFVTGIMPVWLPVIYLICSIIFFTRPKVKEQFK